MYYCIDMQTQWDYIIAGGGCAGRSLAYQMSLHDSLSDKQILVIEKEAKNKNDRTWSFWESRPGPFESIVHRKWENAWVHYDDVSRKLKMQPFVYKTILGKDFYKFTDEAFQNASNISYINTTVHHLDKSGRVKTEAGEFEGKWIFSSLLEKPESIKPYVWLWQHFYGKVIQTSSPQFDPNAVTFMDFRVPQVEGTCFMYILPFSEDEALLEFTVFSKNIWAKDQYQKELEKYINEHIDGPYEVIEEEMGAIPMTDFPLVRSEKGSKIVKIGSAGGASKGSTGYTFGRIQEDATLMANRLANNDLPLISNHFSKSRFRWYDSSLLGMLAKPNNAGDKFFFDLFVKNKTTDVFSFLNEKTSFSTELKIMSSTPIVKMSVNGMAAFNRLLRY